MGSETRLRLKIRDILKKHKVLNSSMICRALNGRDPMPPLGFCHGGQLFGIVRTWKPYTKCNAIKNKCDPDFLKVGKALAILYKKGFIKRKKRVPFRDSGLARWDYFTFWFLDRKDFEEIILKQTLIPYLEIK